MSDIWHWLDYCQSDWGLRISLWSHIYIYIFLLSDMLVVHERALKVATATAKVGDNRCLKFCPVIPAGRRHGITDRI